MKSTILVLRLVACLIVSVLPVLGYLGYLNSASAAPDHAGTALNQKVQTDSQDSQDSQASKTSIGGMLNPDGTLNLAQGFSGALDPTGYSMQTGPNGEPHFVPSEMDKGDKPPSQPPLDAPSGYYTWDSRFNPVGTEGNVSALALDGAIVYLGGEFKVAGKVLANNVARWDGTTWSALGTGTNGPIYTMDFAAGNLYVGGAFTYAGGFFAPNIARWDGSAWHSLGAGINNSVFHIAATATNVYVGGAFTMAGATAANHIARWDGASWFALGSGTNGSSVSTILVNGQDVYVGGTFTTAGSTSVHNVARWDGTSWYDLNGGVSGTVHDFALFGTDLYVGGYFFSSGNGSQVFNNVARYSTTGNQWYALSTGAYIGTTGPVYALVHSTVGYGLYVAGEFATAGELQAHNVVMWSTSGGGWSVLGVGTSNGTNGAVLDLGMTANGYLYVAGIFDVAGRVLTNGGVPANNAARWYGGIWSALGTGLGINGGVTSVNAVLVVTIGGTTSVYVGGAFLSVGNLPANNIARWDGTSWSTLGSGVNNGVIGIVLALARGPGSEIYVGGVFNQAGSIGVHNVARWSSGSGWSNMNGGVTGGSVRALAYNNYDLNLYVGGFFTQAGGSVSVNNIARWNSGGGSNSWSALRQGTTQSNGVDGVVTTIAIRDADHKVYVGGQFDSAGGQTAGNLARWGANGTSFFWNTLGTANDLVSSLVFIDDTLYAGGNFTSMSPGGSVNHVARYSFSAGIWYSLGSGSTNGVNGPVSTLATNGSNLYVGGEFTSAGGTAVNNVTSWNGSAWSTLAGGVSNAVDDQPVSGITVEGSTVYVAGMFTIAGGSKPSYHFARYYYVPLLP